MLPASFQIGPKRTWHLEGNSLKILKAETCSHLCIRADASRFIYGCLVADPIIFLEDITLYIYIQSVPGGMCQTSGVCSLC
jgi:hypothetical protein